VLPYQPEWVWLNNQQRIKQRRYTAEAAGRQAAQSEYEAKLIVEQSKEDARKVRSQVQ
jgi:hypothetical protein